MPYTFNPLQGKFDYYYNPDLSGYLLKSGSIADITTKDHHLLTGLTDDDHSIYPLLLGRAGGQTLIGGINASDNLTLQSSSHATKGKILFGTSAYDEVNNRLGVYTTSPTHTLETGETLGTDLVTNGSFTGSATGWTLGAAWAYGTNAVNKNADGTNRLSQNVGAVSGHTYKITYTISNWTAGSVFTHFGTQKYVASNVRITNGTYTDYITAGSDPTLYFQPSTAARFTIDDVSVVEVLTGDVYFGKGLTLNSGNLTINNGVLGVGISSPTQHGAFGNVVDLGGGISMTNKDNAPNGAIYIFSVFDYLNVVSSRVYQDSATGTGAFHFLNDVTSAYTDFQTKDASGTSASRMLINYLGLRLDGGTGTSSQYAKLQVQGLASGITSIFQANATTPGNISEWRKSDGTIYSHVNSDGTFDIDVTSATAFQVQDATLSGAFSVDTSLGAVMIGKGATATGAAIGQPCVMGREDNNSMYFTGIASGGQSVVMMGRVCKGTYASPTQSLANNDMIIVEGRAYGATAYANQGAAQIRLQTAEAWSDTAWGTQIIFNTTLNTTKTRSEAMRITNDAKLGIGTGATVNARLHVLGAASGITSIFQANATTPGNITEWQSSDATIIAKFDSKGWLGIGNSTTANSGLIDLRGTNWNTVQYMAGLLSSPWSTYNPGASNGMALSGVQGSPVLNAPTLNTSGTVNLNGLLFSPTWKSNITAVASDSALYGVNIAPTFDATGTLPAMYGAMFQLQNNTTGIITNVYNIRVGNIYNNSTGSITNNYGLYINGQTRGATLNYAIYSNAGLVHFGDSVDLASGKNLTLLAGNIATDTTTGTKIGTATNQKIGFFNATPIVQQAHIVDADGTLADITTKFNTLLARMESFGFHATS